MTKTKLTKFTINDATKLKTLGDFSFNDKQVAYSLYHYQDNELIADIQFNKQIYQAAKLPIIDSGKCYYLKNSIKKKAPLDLAYYLVEQYYLKHQIYCDGKKLTHNNLDIIDYEVKNGHILYRAYEYLNDLPLKEQKNKAILIDTSSFYSDKEYGFKAKRQIVFYLDNKRLDVKVNILKYLLLDDKYLFLYTSQDGFFIEIFDYKQNSLLKIKLENYVPSFTAFSLIYYPKANSLLLTMNKIKDDYQDPRNLYLVKLEKDAKPLPLIDLEYLDDGVGQEAYNLPCKAVNTKQYLIYKDEVYFISSKNASTCLYKVGLAKKQVPLLVDDNVNYINLYTDDDKLYALTCNHNQYATLIDVKTNKVLINPNQYLNNKEYAKVKTINIFGRNKQPLQAFFYQPNTIKNKLPLIVMIHGGPNGFYSGGFAYEAQLYVAKGYAVMMPNPRGGNGFGKKHGNTKYAFGKEAMQDCEDIVNYLTENYSFIDKDKVAIVGGSYGGYEAIYAATFSKIFKTAVSLRPFISYQITGSCSGSAGTNPSNKDKKFEEYLKENIKLSLTTYVEKIHIPLEIIHSTLDGNCLIEASIQLFSLLDFYHPELKKRLCLYPNSNHGLLSYGRADLVRQAYQDILDWLRETL